jgi:hypothetical protein
MTSGRVAHLGSMIRAVGKVARARARWASIAGENVGGNVDFILTCLRWLDEGTKTSVSRGNLDMSCETLVP